jgi:seryl-tRNA synthetase
MGDEKNITIGNSTIGESTKISLSVKTALWIIGLVIVLFSSIFTAAYFNVKSEVKSYKEQIDKDKQEFINKVQESIENKLEKQRDKDENFIKDIEEIKGNIRLILDRTQGTRNEKTDASTPTINNNNPSPVPNHRTH